MPSKEEHINQAEHNRKFWNSYDLDSTPFLDWVVTGIFYEGIHWVEAFLATLGHNSATHQQQLRAVSQPSAAPVAPISADLVALKYESENARYGCYKHSADDVRNDLIPTINKIRDHVHSILP